MQSSSAPHAAVGDSRRGVLGSLQRRLVVGIGLAALIVGAAAVPANAAVQPSTVASISRATSTIRPGATATVVGTLSVGGRALSGVTAALQERLSGTTAWHTFQRGTTSSGGSISGTTVPLQHSHDFRVLFHGSAVAAPAASAATTVSVVQSLTITSTSPKSVVAGDPIALAGVATPGLVGRRAYLQLHVASGWVSVSSQIIGSDGAFQLSARATQGGAHAYRVVVHAVSGASQVTSAAPTFIISAWYRLADMQPTASSTVAGVPFSVGELFIAGTPFEQSLGLTMPQGSSIWSDYDLDYGCTSFRATVGPTSDSDPGFYGLFRLSVDDAVVSSVQLDRGSTAPILVDITGGASVRLTSYSITDFGDAAWGNPEVLCTGRP